LSDSTELLLVSGNLLMMGFPGFTLALLIFTHFAFLPWTGADIFLLFIVIEGSDLHKTTILLLVSSDLILMSSPGFALASLPFLLELGAIWVLFILIWVNPVTDLSSSLLLGNTTELLLVSGNLLVMGFPSFTLALLVFTILTFFPWTSAGVLLFFLIIENLSKFLVMGVGLSVS